MTGYIATFKRRELKYRIEAHQLAMFEDALARHMEPDAYGATLISSMYWDTPNRDGIGRSVEHPLYKEKVRLRRYGSRILLDSAPCFVELKKKYAGIVYKRRIQMSAAAAGLFLNGRDFDEAELAFPLVDGSGQRYGERGTAGQQIVAELAAFARRSGRLVPSMLIECQRKAWTLPPDSPYAASELRITLDEDLRYCDLMEQASSSQPTATQRGTPLIDAGEAILEIKAVDAMPRWLVDALNATRIYSGSFTKYGSAYAAVMRETRS